MNGDENEKKKPLEDDDEPETIRDPRKPLTPDANPIDPRAFGGGERDGRH